MTSLDAIAIVLCCGSFHTPQHYGALVKALESKGLEVIVPALPTMNVSQASPQATSEIDPHAPPSGWPTGYTDAEVIKAAIRKQADAGKKVILAGHSYGGWLATESATPELRLDARAAQGQSGGIIGIFYISGYVLPQGQSIDSFFSPQGDETPLPPFVRLHGEGKQGLVMPYDAEQYFFADIPAADATSWAGKLRAQPVIKSNLSQASYIDLPCAYLLCTNDKVFPLAVQEMMVKLATDQGGRMSTYTAPSGHSPFLSWTDGTADAVTDFAGKALS